MGVRGWDALKGVIVRSVVMQGVSCPVPKLVAICGVSEDRTRSIVRDVPWQAQTIHLCCYISSHLTILSGQIWVCTLWQLSWILNKF